MPILFIAIFVVILFSNKGANASEEVRSPQDNFFKLLDDNWYKFEENILLIIGPLLILLGIAYHWGWRFKLMSFKSWVGLPIFIAPSLSIVYGILTKDVDVVIAVPILSAVLLAFYLKFLIPRIKSEKPKKPIPRDYKHLRANELLRACTGLKKSEFDDLTTEQRQDKILEHMNTGYNEILIDFIFPQNSPDVGMITGKLVEGGLKPCSISRAIVSMGANANYLKASALLYNADITTTHHFELCALSLIYQDGMAKLNSFEGITGFTYRDEVRTADDAFAYIMKYYYITSQAAIEATIIRVGQQTNIETQDELSKFQKRAVQHAVDLVL